MSGGSPDDTAELAERVARLERRFERERAARLEAEAIAEAGTRTLYEQTRLQALLETIAVESNLSPSVETVLETALRLICDFTDWPLGHVYFRDIDAPEPILRSAGLWFARDEMAFDEFRDLAERTAFRLGEGLPGRVLASGACLWTPDVGLDPNFPRADAARACGLRGGFAFPVLIGSEVAAVVEFFLDRAHDPDERLLHTLERVGAILGRVIERDRAARVTAVSQAKLEQMVVEAQAASRAKTNFLAVTSHEIRTPLNAVLGLADGLRRAGLDDEQQDLVEGIIDAGAMLLRLLNAVLDIARIETDGVTLNEQCFDLVRLAEAVARLWRTTAAQMGVRLELDVTGLAGAAMIRSDPGKIEQTLVNLVSNAVKFSPPGGRVLMRLTGEAGADGIHIRGAVIDQGPGVIEADRERIFQAYEQTSGGRAAGGAGLGLAICAANIRALGGEISVAPAEGGGSCFRFAFAARPGDLDLLAAESPAPPPRPGLRVLAAEDNPANQRVLAVLLQPLGLQPVFVANGREAVEAMGLEAFDLILMDANMPVMDGIEATRIIRGLSGAAGQTPIVMVTANVFEDDTARYRAAGADGVLAKPIVVSELYSILSRPPTGAGRESRRSA